MFLILFIWEFSPSHFLFSFFLSVLFISFSVIYVDSLIFLYFSFIVCFLRRFSWLYLPVLLVGFFFWLSYFFFSKSSSLLFILFFYSFFLFHGYNIFSFPPEDINRSFSDVVFCLVSLTLEVLSSHHQVYWFRFLSFVFEDFLKCLVLLGCKFIIKSKGYI